MPKKLSKEQKQFCAKAATKLVSEFMKKHPEGVSRLMVRDYFVELQNKSVSYGYLGYDMKSLYATASFRLSYFGKQKDVKVEKRFDDDGIERSYYSFKNEPEIDPLDGTIATFGKNKYRLTRIY